MQRTYNARTISKAKRKLNGKNSGVWTVRDRHCHLITCGVARVVTISRDCLSLRCAMRDASHILFLSVLGASRIGLTLDWRQRGFFSFFNWWRTRVGAGQTFHWAGCTFLSVYPSRLDTLFGSTDDSIAWLAMHQTARVTITHIIELLFGQCDDNDTKRSHERASRLPKR